MHVVDNHDFLPKLAPLPRFPISIPYARNLGIIQDTFLSSYIQSITDPFDFTFKYLFNLYSFHPPVTSNPFIFHLNYSNSLQTIVLISTLATFNPFFPLQSAWSLKDTYTTLWLCLKLFNRCPILLQSSSKSFKWLERSCRINPLLTSTVLPSGKIKIIQCLLDLAKLRTKWKP